MEGYMHLTEAARELGVTRRALLARIARGDMTALRVHEKLWLVSTEEVERWKSLGKLKPGPKPQRAESGPPATNQ
jgi:excisionase family DNA binding protein